jgi:hypothetical protein
LASLPSGTAIPSALANLLTIATATFPVGTTVWFGATLPAYSAPLTFQITEITGDQSPAELGNNYRREEKFNLVCSLIAYAGGAPDFNAQLQSLMANFILLSQAIANNPTLSGAVRYADTGNFIITPETDANSQSAVTLDFNVRCEQRVTSLN